MRSNGRFGPALRKDVEGGNHGGLHGPGLPYSHLKATLTSWESPLDVADALNEGSVELARGFVRLVSLLRGPGALCAPGSGSKRTIVRLVSSSRGPGSHCARLVPEVSV